MLIFFICQESFIVKRAKENVLKENVQRQQGKKGSFKLKRGSFKLKKPAESGTQGAPRMRLSPHGFGWLAAF